MVVGSRIPSAWLRVDRSLHVLHHVFVEGFVIRNATLPVHAPKDRVVNAVMQKIHQFAKTTFRDEISRRFELGLDVLEKHGIVETVSAPEAGVSFAVVVVTLDEIFHVVALREIRTDAALRV